MIKIKAKMRVRVEPNSSEWEAEPIIPRIKEKIIHPIRSLTIALAIIRYPISVLKRLRSIRVRATTGRAVMERGVPTKVQRPNAILRKCFQDIGERTKPSRIRV